jgi:pre-mRNA-splicing helicase BRR2
VRSNAEERVNREVAMREKGLGWILRELAGDRQAKSAVEAMDVDEPQQVNIAGWISQLCHSHKAVISC